MSIEQSVTPLELDLPVGLEEDIQLTDSQIFGLVGDTIDTDVAIAQARLHEASDITIEDASVDLQEKVIEAVPHAVSDDDLEQIDFLVRRGLVLAHVNRRRRQMAKPIISLAVSYPSTRRRY